MNALRLVLVLSLVVMSGLSCGGGSKEDPVALCKQGCDKTIDLCASELGGLDPATFKSICQASCTSNMGANNGMTCKNSNAILSALKVCLNKTTCTDLMTCTAGVPACEGGSTGTGGSSGTGSGGSSGTGTGGRSGTGSGGSSGTGTGGSSGAGSGGSSGGGTGCADLLACCNKTTNAQIKSLCMTQYSLVMSMGDDVCQQALDAIKATYCP